MKELWHKYRERIDAATLRERVLIFGACALVMIVLLNALLIDPTLAKHRRISLEISQRQAEIGKVQLEIKKVVLGRQVQPDKETLARLADIRRRTKEVEDKLAREQKNLVPPDQVGAMLEEILSRNRKLLLVEMKSLPVANLAQRSASGQPAVAAPARPAVPAPVAAPPAPGGAEAVGPGVFRHGVEITVTGSYLDLMSYLKDLEKLPRQLYWGQFDLSVVDHPQLRLKIAVFTLSLDPVWLVV